MIGAAYEAFRSGLSISLVVAGVVILAAGLLAWVTLGPVVAARRTTLPDPEVSARVWERHRMTAKSTTKFDKWAPIYDRCALQTRYSSHSTSSR